MTKNKKTNWPCSHLVHPYLWSSKWKKQICWNSSDRMFLNVDPLTRPLKKCFEISHDAPSKHPIENKERVWRSNFNSNITSFIRFVNKRAIYRLGIISLAHAPVHVTDFLVVNVHVDELSSTRIWQHKLCATLSANVNINYHLPIKVYNRICTLRHIRIEMINGSQMCFEF